jgi:hypothetical protein
MIIKRRRPIFFLLFSCISVLIMASLFSAEACRQNSANKNKPQIKKFNEITKGGDKKNDQKNLDFIDQAKQISMQYALTDISLDCLKFILLEGLHDGKVIVDVRELHNETCGGDPVTSPRLYSIGFDKTDSSIWSDAKSLVGQMEPLESAK